MTREEKEARIREVVSHYLPLLHLDRWEIRCVFFPTRQDITGGPDEECAASCIASPEYQHAKLTFTLDDLAEDSLEEDVLHELVHAVHWPTGHLLDLLLSKHEPKNTIALDYARYLTEQATTAFQKILWEALPKCP